MWWHPLLYTFWSPSQWCLSPSHTPSISGHYYYILFIDEYTSVSWVYLLYDRSKLITMVTHFITKIVTQYCTIPKILCTDNVLEFVKTSLCTLCANSGIIHLPPILTPPRKMVSLSGNTISSLILLAHYWLRCMSHITFGLMSLWLPTIFRIDSPLIPSVILFPFTIFYPPHLSSPFLLRSSNVLPLPKITLLPSLNSPLMLSNAYLLANPRHKRAIKCTFLTLVIMWLHEDSPSLSLNPPAGSPLLGSPPWESIPPPPLSFYSPSPLFFSNFPFSSTLDTSLLSPSSTVTSPSPDITPQAPPNEFHIPIALCKGTCTYTRHPISHSISYDQIFPSFRASLSGFHDYILRWHRYLHGTWRWTWRWRWWFREELWHWFPLW